MFWSLQTSSSFSGWEQLEAMHFQRSGCAAAATGGYLYVVGGFSRAMAQQLAQGV